MTDLTKLTKHNVLIWIVAFCIMQFPMRYIYLNIVKGENVKIWYNFKKFNIYNVFTADLFYMLAGLMIAYRIYNHFLKNEDNIYKFFAIFLVVQIIGDLTFYTFISNIPAEYDTKWIKFFKNYGKNSGLNALFGDSIYILVWAITAYSIRNFSLDALLFILFTFIFIVSAIAES